MISDSDPYRLTPTRKEYLAAVELVIPRELDQDSGKKSSKKWDGDNFPGIFITQGMKVLKKLPESEPESETESDLPLKGLPISGFFEYLPGSNHIWQRIIRLCNAIRHQLQNLRDTLKQFKSKCIEYQRTFLRPKKMPEIVFLLVEAAFWTSTPIDHCGKFLVQCHREGEHGPRCNENILVFKRALQVLWPESLGVRAHHEVIEPSTAVLAKMLPGSSNLSKLKRRRTTKFCAPSKRSKVISNQNCPGPFFRVHQVDNAKEIKTGNTDFTQSEQSAMITSLPENQDNFSELSFSEHLKLTKSTTASEDPVIDFPFTEFTSSFNFGFMKQRSEKSFDVTAPECQIPTGDQNDDQFACSALVTSDQAKETPDLPEDMLNRSDLDGAYVIIEPSKSADDTRDVIDESETATNYLTGPESIKEAGKVASAFDALTCPNTMSEAKAAESPGSETAEELKTHNGDLAYPEQPDQDVYGAGMSTGDPAQVSNSRNPLALRDRDALDAVDTSELLETILETSSAATKKSEVAN